ncbi:MAG: hypothetical protein KIT89_11235 [Microcella sp.]|uniref:hypothetical protein n=1 Tax=Microcella sp. TaxID=1913979 RepID=UPI0024C68A8F|nr:hypothetical protein [Microcella sp.]UYN83260.1 MAG: hypothetical protein KIT89_11235 [Microcella sp.]
MVTKKSSDVDPRFPPVYQRGGESALPPVNSAPLSTPELDDAPLATGAAARFVSRDRERMPFATVAASAVDPQGDGRHFELVVAGNPWLRALWVVGSAATAVGFALTFYAEFAFSAPPPGGIYDPSFYVVPRLAEAVSLPLVIAGVVALVAATTLRLVAWRPSGTSAIERE